MTYFVHSPALDFIPLANTSFCNVRLAIAFIRKWDVTILSMPMTSAGIYIPISWVNENRNTSTRHNKNLVHNYRPSANPK